LLFAGLDFVAGGCACASSFLTVTHAEWYISLTLALAEYLGMRGGGDNVGCFLRCVCWLVCGDCAGIGSSGISFQFLCGWDKGSSYSISCCRKLRECRSR
jgi:hypothetical protein